MVVREKVLLRTCVSCGKPLVIKVAPDGSYRGGHYFGTVDMSQFGFENIPRELREIWECDECYRRDPFKGKRVPVYDW